MPKYPEITIPINQHKDNPIAWITLCFQALSILNKQDEMNVLLRRAAGSRQSVLCRVAH